MPTLYQQLFQERHDLTAEASRLAVAAAARTPAGMTAEEQARDDEIFARLDAIAPQLEREERRREAERTAAIATGQQVDFGLVTGMHDRSADRPWGSFGEQLQAIMQAGMPGAPVDTRLLAAASGASSGVPADGGFLVQTDYSTRLLNRAVEAAVLAPRCSTIEIGADADGIEMPYIDETSRANGSRWGGVQVYWRAEADTVTATKPKFAEQELRLQDLMGLAYATGRLLKDATALESVFSMAFTSEFAFKLDDAIVNGDGVGKPLGFLSSSGPRVQVAKETGQAAATVVFENVVKMWSRLLPSARRNAIWAYNTDIEPQLLTLNLGLGTAGVPVYLPPSGIREDPFGSLFGRPMVPIEQAQTLGTEGDLSLVDLSGYMLIRKGGIQADQSMHVRFIYDEQTFRWMYRVNGRPILRSAITPFKGSATKSDFVTLATRA